MCSGKTRSGKTHTPAAIMGAHTFGQSVAAHSNGFVGVWTPGIQSKSHLQFNVAPLRRGLKDFVTTKLTF
jgi:hypothetical protein